MDAHHFTLTHHFLTARPTRRGGATATHEPNEIDDHSRLTETVFQPLTETSKADEHFNFHRADLQALQYSQAIEDIQVNLASGSNQPVVLDGINSIGSTLSPNLQLGALDLYSAGAGQKVENIVVHTYMHDEVAINAFRHAKDHRIDTVT